MLESEKRDLTIDIIKAIGIIFMVAGHCQWPFKHFIYLFHMAIFFIASGYCYKEKYSSDIKTLILFVKRKIITLWVPYVAWMSIYSILHNFFIYTNIYTNNKNIFDYISGPYIGTTQVWSIYDIIINIIKAMLLHGRSQLGGALWFLATLMEVSIAYCIVDFILNRILKRSTIKNVAQSVVSITFLLIGYVFFLQDIKLQGIDRVLSYYILFHSGFIIHKYEISSKKRTNKQHLVIAVGAFLILLICNEIGTIALDRNSYKDPLFFMIVSLSGWQFLYEISYFLKTQKYNDILVYIGQNTLSIVILHFLCFKIVNFVGVIVYNSPTFLAAAFPVLYTGGMWWFVYMIVGMVIPLCLNAIWRYLVTHIVYKDVK